MDEIWTRDESPAPTDGMPDYFCPACMKHPMKLVYGPDPHCKLCGGVGEDPRKNAPMRPEPEILDSARTLSIFREDSDEIGPVSDVSDVNPDVSERFAVERGAQAVPVRF